MVRKLGKIMTELTWSANRVPDAGKQKRTVSQECVTFRVLSRPPISYGPPQTPTHEANGQKRRFEFGAEWNEKTKDGSEITGKGGTR